jgi:hypothetical protein
MLPDITSNTWAKNMFIIFFLTEKCTIYNHEKSLEEMDAGTLVAAVVIFKIMPGNLNEIVRS